MILALGLSAKPVKASHIAGGTIHIQQLDTLGNYIVYLNLYRDCNGIALAHPVLHAIANTTEIADTLSAVNRIRVTDITGIGDSCSAQSRCNGGTFPYGMEAHLYADTLNLGSLPVCEVTVYYDAGVSRYAPISGPPPPNQYFFITATINKCLVNSTPYFQNFVPQLIGFNKDQFMSYAAVDSQDMGDSISYDLVTPLVSLNTPITYWPNSNNTYYRPLNFLGYPNHLANWPGGFNLNPNTGLLRFRPTVLNQVTWWAVRVREWRKINGVSTVISQVTYDAMYIMINMPPQVMPTVNNLSIADEQSDVYLCSQDTFRMQFDVQDADGDSVFVKWDGLPAGSNLSVRHDSTSAAQVNFSWFPGSNRVRTQPYFLNLEFRDQACPIANRTSRSIRLFVRDSIPAPHINLGSDTVIRNFSDSLRLAANISNQLNRAIRWTSSGDGHFNRADTLYPTYIPGTNDRTSCQYSLYCEVLDFGCGGPGGKWIDTLNVIREYDSLSINPLNTIYYGDTLSLNLTQTPPVKQFLRWRTMGDGTIVDSSQVQTRYIPGPQDWASCTWGILADYQYTGCTVLSDTQYLTRSSSFNAASALQQALRGDTIFIEAHLDSSRAGSIHWSTLGDGQFGDTLASQTWYLPGTQDYSNCQSTLLVREWPFGSCLGNADSLTILKQIPSWSAGLSQQLKYGDTAYLNAQPAPTSNYQFGYWTSSGDGHFTDSNDAQSAYILGAQDWASCAVGIYWNEIDQACGGRTDSLALVRKSTTIDAGVDLMDYYTPNLSFQLNGWSDTSNGVTAYWKTLGDGTFSDTLDLNAVYTPGTQDKDDCFVLLSLIEYPQGTCTNFDGIRIDIVDTAITLLSVSLDSTTFDSVFFNFDNPYARYIYVTNSSGTGSFVRPNPNQLIYVLSANDKQGTLVKINGMARALCAPDYAFGADIHPQLIKTGLVQSFTGISMYPNPNKGEFRLSFQDAPSLVKRVEAYAADGKQIELRWEIEGNEMLVGLTEPPPGVYMLRIVGDNRVYTQRFTVQD